MGVLRAVRTGESAVDGVVGAGAGVGMLRPERVGRSGATGDECAEPASCATELYVGRGGKTGVLEDAWDAFGAGARTGTCGGMFPASAGIGTRSASRINRKSRPNS